MNTAFRGCIAGLAVFICAACEIGPIDSVDIVEVRCGDTVDLPETPDLSEYPLTYTITVKYNSTLFKGELVLMFNTDDPDVFQENGIYDWNSDKPPNRFSTDKGEGTHTFDVSVKKPSWMAPLSPPPAQAETSLSNVPPQKALLNLTADGSLAETTEAEAAIAEESLTPETLAQENDQTPEAKTGDWKAVVYLRQKFGEDKMVQSESAVKLPLPAQTPDSVENEG
ncbi:MAG: hypothetical protein LBD20_04090 [Spirochaetaceae bacterium]|nr:hypothetical protein [Spirochaetaceae bacterium]